MTTPGYYRRAMRRLRALFGGMCIICGSKRKLEFAHIKPTRLMSRGRGRSDRYHDVKKNQDCYVLLCRRCHIVLDTGGVPGY